MNNRLNFFKRLTAFLLAMLLVTTMMGNDFFSLATSDEIITEESVETGDSSSAPEATPAPEAVDIPQEPAAEEQQEPSEPGQVVEPTTNDAEIPTEQQPTVDENGNPVVVPTENQPNPETPAEPKESIDDAEVTPNPENIDKPETDKTNEEDIEDPDAKDKEEGIDDEEKEDEEELVKGEEEECEHEWKYVSNGNGTHFRKCSKCDEEGEQEDCDYDENGVCRKCGYEDNSLVFQTFSKEILGTTVTVEGEMPRNADVTIYYVGKKAIENIVNDSLDEGVFKAYAAYDITIYDRYGNKYQPDNDNNAVKVTFESVNKLEEVPDEDVTVFRIEDDYSVTEIEADASGEDVSFDAEHFSIYVTGTNSTVPYVTVALGLTDGFGYVKQNDATSSTSTSPYIRLKKAKFAIYADEISTYSFRATVYKNVSETSDIADATAISTGTASVEATAVGKHDVEIELTTINGQDDYIAQGDYYAVVINLIQGPSTNINLVYGTGAIPTYVLDEGWQELDQNGVFVEDPSNNLEVLDATTDTYTITSITGPDPSSVATSGTKLNPYATGANDSYLYSKGDTGTFVANLSNAAATRAITWSVVDSSIIDVNATTGEFTAKKSGDTTVTATYKNASGNNTKSINVKVLEFTINGKDPDSITADIDYTGAAVEPAVVAYQNKDNGQEVTVTSSYSENTKATSGAKVAIKYTISGKNFVFNRTFTINKRALVSGVFTNDTTLTVENGVITAIGNTDPTGLFPSTAKPVFGQDFTATIVSTSTSIDGLTYVVRINAVADGNFTTEAGGILWTKATADNVGITAEIVSGSSFDPYVYTGTAITLPENWSEVVTFRNGNGEVIDYINKTTAEYKITDRSGATSEEIAKNAGDKSIVFTITSGGLTGIEIKVDFVVVKADISKATINWTKQEFLHDGTEHKAAPGEDFTVSFNGQTLVYNTDYTVDYSPTGNYVDITGSSNVPQVIIKGAGNNFDSDTKKEDADTTYKIVANFAMDAIVRIRVGSTNYDGTADKNYVIPYTKVYDGNSTAPNIILMMDGTTYTEGTDYTKTVVDKDGTTLSANVGTKVITITPLNTDTSRLKGQTTVITATYEVGKRPLTTSMVDISNLLSKEIRYTGSAIDVVTASSSSNASDSYDVKVSYNGNTLNRNSDYKLTCENNVNVTSTGATFTIEGMGNYTGTLTSSNFKFNILPAIITKDTGDSTKALARFAEDINNIAYTGTAKEPSVKVELNGNEVSEEYYKVNYDSNIAVGTDTATATIIGSGNLTGTAILTFSIKSNTEKVLDIRIQTDYVAKYLPNYDEKNGEEITRYYTCDVPVEYTGSDFNGSVAVYYDDTKLKYKTDYTYTYVNAKNAKDYDTTVANLANNPYVLIQGKGNYKNSICKVLFSIKPVNLESDTVKPTVTFAEKDNFIKAYTGNPVDLEELVVKVGSKTLTMSTDGGTTGDYTVTYNDDKSSAGEKSITITGINNYRGSLTKEYTVGTKVSEVLVSIQSGTFDSTGNPEDLTGDKWPVQVSLSQKGNSLDNPLEIPYRGNHAPKVILYSKDGKENLEGSFTISEPESSIGLTGDSLYDSRKPGEKGDDYNILKYSVTMDGSKGYYSETDENGKIKPLNIFVRIMPVNIRPGEGRVSQEGNSSPSIEYNGEQTVYNKEYKFRFGKVDDLYTLKKDKDLVGYPIMIGEEVGANQKKYVEGVGNFTNTIEYTITVNKGYVIVSGKKDAATADTDARSIKSWDTQTLDLGALYTYKENVAQLPVIKLTATNETKVLELGTDYEIISYPSVDEQMGKVNLDKDLTITIKTKGDKYVEQTINIKYRIASNNISKFYGTLSDIPYTATTVDIDTIKKATLKLATTKGGTELTKGKDFELVETDAETQEARFQAQFGNVYSKAVVTDSLPSYQTNYIFVKGIGIYSGYCRIPFNIILDLGNDAYTKVTMPKDSYELGDDGKPTGNEYVPTIKYRDVNGAQDTYTKELKAPEVQVTETDGTTTTKTLTNYMITRDREGKPGPDGSIAVTGSYNCTGTAKNVQSVNGKDVSFQIRLSNYGDLAISGNGIYSYTGNAVIPSIKGLADIGAIKAPVVMENDVPVIQNGEGVDYGLKYQYSSEPETNVAVKVGKWKVIVEATSTSRFFIPGTSKELEFYIKYDLANATMKFANADDTDPSKPPKVGYTGGPYSFVNNVTITDKDGSTIIYSKDQNTLVTLNPTEKTDMGEYTIVANPKDKDSAYCYGTCSTKFVISGISLSEATVTLDKDSDEYTGKAITPKVTVKNGTMTLVENTDYKVKYEDNINAGTARVVVSGINNYSGSITKTFTITKKDLSGCTVSFGDAYYVGDKGAPNVEPTVTVKNGTVELRPGVDYKEITSADFINNESIATAVLNKNKEESSWLRPSVTISATPNGNYTGSITPKFTIEKLDIETNQAVNIAATSAEFTGDIIDPYEAVDLSVTYKNVDTPLVKYDSATEQGDYSIEILDSAGTEVTSLISMGLYKMVITGKNSCTGERIIDFTVTQRSLPNNYHYYYSTEKPGFEGTWRELTTADFGTTPENYKPGFVTEGGLTNDKLKIYIYDCTTVKAGEDNIPDIAIIDLGVKDPQHPTDSTKHYELIKDKDYTVTVSNAQKAGTAEWNRAATEDWHATVAATSPAITITGQGDYTGSITLPFNIGKNINNQGLKITYSVNGTDYAYDASFGTYSSTSPRWQYTYNGTAQVPVVKVTTSSDVRLSSTKDYSVSYTDGVGNDDSSINAGYKYVVITGKGDYCGTMIQRYQINRKKITAEPVITNPKTTAAGGTYFTTEVNPYAADKTDAGTYGNPVLTFRLTGLNKLTDETAKKYLAAHGLKTDDDNNQTADYVGYYYGIYSGTAIKPEITVYDNTLGTAGTTTKQIAGGDDGDLDINYLNDNTKTLFNDDGTILRCGEVTIGFKANTNTLESTSKGNYYVGSESAKYRFRYIIVARDITSDDFVAEFVEGLDKPQDYTGSFIEPEVSVTNGGSPLVKYDESTDEGDYKLTYEDNVIPGTATVTITGVNNYTGTKKLHFDIMGNLNNDTVECSKDDNGNYIKGAPKQIYTGTSITKGNPQIYLMLEGTTDYPKDVILTYGEEYMVSGVGDTDNYVSYGTIIYSGVEAKYWKGDKSVYYDIEFNESEIHVNNNEGDYKYTGFPIVPKFTLNVSTAEIKSTKYYQNSKEINPNADADKQYFTNNGTIDVVITYDVGNKKGNTATTQYNIVPRPIEECKVEYARDFHRYTGSAVEPAFSISIISKNLQTDKEQIYTDLQVFDEATNSGDYTVDYGNYVYSTSEDDCSIILSANSDKLSGKLTGTKICPYTIKLQSVANLRVTEKTGDSLTIDWVKDLFADGTQLKIDVKQSDGTYTGYMTTRVVGNTNTYKIEGLSGSTTYKITAKSYAEPEAGVTIYSAPKTIEETTGVEESSITVKRTASDPTKATITLPKGGNVLVYYIYRSTDTTSKGKLCAIIPKDTGAYTNTNLSSGVTYYYYVKGYAINSSTGKLEPVNQSEYVEAKVE